MRKPAYGDCGRADGWLGWWAVVAVVGEGEKITHSTKADSRLRYSFKQLLFHSDKLNVPIRPVGRAMLEKLILYFVCKTKGHITKTQLVKFLYLADLYSVKWTGQQLTELDWCYYTYGPWEQGIDEALCSMEGSIKLRESGDAIMIDLDDQSLLNAEFDFPLGLNLMLENIRKEWAGSNKLQPLLDYVYATAPMVDARSKSNPENKAPLNLFLEHEKVMAELGV